MMSSTVFTSCVYLATIIVQLTFAYDCKIEEGNEPNLDDYGCESYWYCHHHQGTLKQCHGNKQFDFKLRECMPNSEVWCQWQHKQLRELRSGGGRQHIAKPKIQHVHHIPKPQHRVSGPRRVVKVINVKDKGHSHDHEHEDGTVHSHPHGHEDHHHDHDHVVPNIATSFTHSHDGSTHTHLVDENGQFVDSTDHYHLKKEEEGDKHDYHDGHQHPHSRPLASKRGHSQGGSDYGNFQDSGSDPEVVKTVTHSHDGSTHTHFVDDDGEYSYDYDPEIIYEDDYNGHDHHDEHYDDSNNVDMDYDVGSHEDSHGGDYKEYDYDDSSDYDYTYDYDDIIGWGYMCASKFGHEPNMKDSMCKTFFRCDNYKGTKIYCKPDHLYDFHAKACRYYAQVDCHHQIHDYEKNEPKHHTEIEKKGNGMTIVHHYFHGGKKGLEKSTDASKGGLGLFQSLQNIPLEAALNPFGAIGSLLLATRQRNVQLDIRNKAAQAMLISRILDLASRKTMRRKDYRAPLIARRATRRTVSRPVARAQNPPNATVAKLPPANVVPLSLGSEVVVAASGRMNKDGTSFVSAVVSEWAPEGSQSVDSDPNGGQGDNGEVFDEREETSLESEVFEHDTDDSSDEKNASDTTTVGPKSSEAQDFETTTPKSENKIILSTERPAKPNPLHKLHLTKISGRPNLLANGFGPRKTTGESGHRQLSPPYYAIKGSVTQAPYPKNLPDLSDKTSVAIKPLDKDSPSNPPYKSVMPLDVNGYQFKSSEGRDSPSPRLQPNLLKLILSQPVTPTPSPLTPPPRDGVYLPHP